MFIDTPRVCKTVVFLLLLTPLAHAQTTATTAQLRPALQILDTTKEQDGLVGAVRRVKTEYARINLKEGRPVEGPRQLLELTTYGVRGNRVDNVSYPIADSAIGREQYKYDDRGNIIEKVLRDDGGAVLSREAYDYVFDEVGNWTKMVTTLVVVENGEFKREPIEVTYRTVTYYAGDTITRNVAATPPENGSSPTGVASNTERIEKTSGAVLEKPSNGRSRRRINTQTSPIESRSPAQEPAEQRNGSASEVEPRGTVETAVTRNNSTDKPAPPTQRGPETWTTPEGASGTNGTETAISLTNSTEKPAPSIKKAPETRTVPEGSSGTNGTGTAEPLISTEKPALPTEKARETRTTPEGAFVTNPNVETAKPDATSSTVNNPAELKSPTKIDADGERPPTGNTVSTENLASGGGPTSSAATKAMEIYQTGRQRFEAGDVSAAIDAYLESSRLLPGSAEIQLNLGHAYLTMKKDKDAIKAFKEAVKFNPQLAEAYYGLGFASFRSDKYRDAMDAFKKATLLSPNMAKAHYGLALAYIQLEKMDEMIHEYRLLQRLDSKMALKLSQAFPDVRFNCQGTRYCR